MTRIKQQNAPSFKISAILAFSFLQGTVNFRTSVVIWSQESFPHATYGLNLLCNNTVKITIITEHQ